MATIRHHARIAAPPERVWAAVSDPAGIAEWFPGLGTVTFDGSVRTIDMGGLTIKEEIVTNDDDLRRFQYRITEAPMPTEYHLATIDVLDDGDGSLVVYSCEILPGELKEILDPTLAGALEGLRRHCEGG
jgi:uncharacterized protein YndB with AHSA1/START domain